RGWRRGRSGRCRRRARIARRRGSRACGLSHTGSYVKFSVDIRGRMSTRARKRDVAKLETRRALIAAGAAEFTENGIEGSSLDAICARAGLTRGAFYVHFKDRDDLLKAILDVLLESFYDQVITTGDSADLET